MEGDGSWGGWEGFQGLEGGDMLAGSMENGKGEVTWI